MALTDGNGTGMYMPVAPAYGGGYNSGFGGWGGDGWWVILFLFALMGNGWGGGFGGFGGAGNMMLGYDFPWLMNGQQGINANTNNGFQNAFLNDNIISIRDGIGNLSTQICNTGSDIQMSLANGFAGVESGANARQIANMQTAFANQTAMNQGFNNLQSQLAQCCCDNRLATQDLKYTIATEACADRATSTANTQAILDKLCQLELDGVKAQVAAEQRENANLRTELMYARGQASQIEQTAILRQGQEAEVDALYNRLSNCPVPTTPVYGRQPIFTCNNNNSCGCGCGSF